MKKRTQHLIFALSALGILLGARRTRNRTSTPVKARARNNKSGISSNVTTGRGSRPGLIRLLRRTPVLPRLPSKAAPQGGLVQGGARGAALGAVGGAIAGDAGKGAAIGAATGAMVGGMRRADQGRSEKQQQRDVAPQGGAPSTQGRSNYERAQRACLEGRGYTVQ